ncbi:hypothetical protein VNI00_014213 [Paramarasmius palmivorus]|uniref:Mid2 domain-containing protein n=1 Tax=Paramarasmius palmivorus TaxID=297713 RepID=A0AAW0BYN8_9AGAR
MLKLFLGVGLVFLLRTKALEVVDVNPTTATLHDGTITLNITWHSTVIADFQFVFVLERLPFLPSPIQAHSQDYIYSVSSGTYELSAIQLDSIRSVHFETSQPPGKNIDGIFTSQITVIGEASTVESLSPSSMIGPTSSIQRETQSSSVTGSLTTNSAPGSETTHTDVSSSPLDEPTSSQAMPASQNISRIAGPVVGAAVMLIILIAVGIVILRRKRTSLSTIPPKVFPYPNTKSVLNGVRAGKRQPEGVDQKLDVAHTLLDSESEDSIREEAPSSIENNALPRREDREQNTEIGSPMRTSCYLSR